MHLTDWIVLFLNIPGAIKSMIDIGQEIFEFIRFLLRLFRDKKK